MGGNKPCVDYLRAILQEIRKARYTDERLVCSAPRKQHGESCSAPRGGGGRIVRWSSDQRRRVLACVTAANLKQGLQRNSIFRSETTPFDGFGANVLAAIRGFALFVT